MFTNDLSTHVVALFFYEFFLNIRACFFKIFKVHFISGVWYNIRINKFFNSILFTVNSPFT
jgi:hypothetical protein